MVRVLPTSMALSSSRVRRGPCDGEVSQLPHGELVESRTRGKLHGHAASMLSHHVFGTIYRVTCAMMTFSRGQFVRELKTLISLNLTTMPYVVTFLVECNSRLTVALLNLCLSGKVPTRSALSDIAPRAECSCVSCKLCSNNKANRNHIGRSHANIISSWKVTREPSHSVIPYVSSANMQMTQIC